MNFMQKTVLSRRKSLEEFPLRGRRKKEKKRFFDFKKFCVIAELKMRSPATGIVFAHSAGGLAKAYQLAGAGGLSVVTEPEFFHGSLDLLRQAVDATTLPVLAKDFVSIPKHLDLLYENGADYALLISEVFEQSLALFSLTEAIEYAHGLGLQVLLETHSRKQFENALDTKADVIGVNNRNLRALSLNTLHYQTILEKNREYHKPVIVESGFQTPTDLIKAKEFGANGVLVGTALLSSENVFTTAKKLVDAVSLQ